jgi:hypothetical protein
MKDAISDAKSLHRSLFVYVFCNENPVSNAMDKLFQSPGVARLIASKCIFYPISATTADGYSAITGCKFTSLPLFLLVIPHGDSLKACRVSWVFQGDIAESGLIAALESIRGPAPREDPIRAEQDRYFLEAVQDDVQRIEEREWEEQQQELIAEREDAEKERIEREFAALPILSPSQEDVLCVKFHFENNSEKMWVFPRSGSLSMLYIFARKFEYPRTFALKSGFPIAIVPDDETKLNEVFRERNVLIHVTDSG